MARKPQIPDDDYRHILDFLIGQGYQLADLKKVPHAVNSVAE
jgi:hypothetical protein